MIKKRRSLSKSDIGKFRKFVIFFNSERTRDLTDAPASIYDRKTATRRFSTFREILRSLSLAQSLLKDRNAARWRIENRGVQLLS